MIFFSNWHKIDRKYPSVDTLQTQLYSSCMINNNHVQHIRPTIEHIYLNKILSYNWVHTTYTTCMPYPSEKVKC